MLCIKIFFFEGMIYISYGGILSSLFYSVVMVDVQFDVFILTILNKLRILVSRKECNNEVDNK